MADREDIIDLLTRYATGIDRQDWELFRSVFTDDCVLDYGQIGSWHGVDGVTDYMIQVHVPFEHTLHRLSNHAIQIDGDTATARTYVDVLLIARDAKPHKTSDVNAAGFYDDELVRTDGGWRINRRQLTMVRNRPL